jgi:hypothetical protein
MVDDKYIKDKEEFKKGYRKEHSDLFVQKKCIALQNAGKIPKDNLLNYIDFGDLRYELPIKARRYVEKWANNDINDEDRGAAFAIADELMKGDLTQTLIGAIVYEKLGQGNRLSVKRRLRKAYNNARNVDSRIEEGVEEFFKRNSNWEDLEKKVLTSVFGIFVVAGLFFSLSSFTGVVIGFSKSISLPIGVLLFVLGVLGLFFSKKF